MTTNDGEYMGFAGQLTLASLAAAADKFGPDSPIGQAYTTRLAKMGDLVSRGLAGTGEVIPDLPMQMYLELPHLSASGIGKILPPDGCPALFKYNRDNPEPAKDYFTLGEAAHSLILEDGAEVVEVVANDRKSSKTRDREDELRAEGKIPLITPRFNIVHAMAAKLREHEGAMALLSRANGKPEQTVLWRGEDGVLKKARPDWLPDTPAEGAQLIIPEYKTAVSVAPDDLEKAAARFGYHRKAVHYCEGVEASGWAQTAAMCFIFQMSTAPYLVELKQYSQVALQIGAQQNREAARIFKQCEETNTWPGFSEHQDVPEVMNLPRWAEKQHEERLFWS